MEEGKVPLNSPSPRTFVSEMFPISRKRRRTASYFPLIVDSDEEEEVIEEDEDVATQERIDGKRRNSLDSRKIVLGICAMEKKSKSKQMMEMLKRVEAFPEFNIVIFDNETILNKPIEDWPLCDCLISFFSSGFPLKKAIEYVNLRRPFLINDLKAQELLLDRHKVYQILEQYEIPTPRYAVVRRDVELVPSMIIEEDIIYVNGMRFDKPFVEKPVDSEDHKVIIYFPRAAGGGSQHLFRKVGDRSSQFCKEEDVVRTEGSYIYEDFLPTQGTDVKVYAVGPNYFHAEARKSPVVDGKVNRGTDGKELRYPIMLTTEEKEIAMKITLAFKQTVCGFDLLRANGRSYVCDVNGWSFVKNSVKFYDDTANILREIILRKLAPWRLDMMSLGPIKTDDDEEEKDATPRKTPREELRCVIAVIRHGDRTPKQKMKMIVTNELILSFFNNFGVSTRKEVKLKSAVQLQRLLDTTRTLLSSRTGDEDSDIEESVEKLKQMRAVLEKGGKFAGINRKAQIKPLKWDQIKDAAGNLKEIVVEAQLILKWGGELTTAGKAQAEKFGHHFRNIYPGEDGLLRLHSTYRHDLKIYASDEGRVQMTAAAFAKGLLDLEGELPPILVSLVVKDQMSYALLDDSSQADQEMQAAKKVLHEYMTVDEEVYPTKVRQYVPTMASSLVDSVKAMTNPKLALQNVRDILDVLVSELKELNQNAKLQEIEQLLYEGESISLVYKRYSKLNEDFYRKKKDKFDISKLPDIYDCVKYDMIHNFDTLKLQSFQTLYDIVKPLADYVVPQEYGMTFVEKRKIGQKICKKLVEKIILDLDTASSRSESSQHVTETFYKLDARFSKDIKIKSPGREVRTRLYFTSESHVQTLFNVLRFGSPNGKMIIKGLERLSAIDELNYLTMIAFRLYEKPGLPKDDPTRFRVCISFSPGISTNIAKKDQRHSHALPLEPLFNLTTTLTLIEVEDFLRSALIEIPDESYVPFSAQ